MFKKAFKNMKLASKLIISFLIVTILASISGIASISSIQTMRENSDIALQKYGFATGEIGGAIVMVTDSRRAVRDILFSEDDTELQTAEGQLKTIWEKHETYFENVKNSIINEEGEVLVAEIETELVAYQKVQDDIIAKCKKTVHEERAGIETEMKEQLDPQYDKLYTVYTELYTQKKEVGQEVSAKLEKRGHYSVIVSWVLVISSFIVAILLSLFTAKSIVGPINKILVIAADIETGNLHSELDIDSNDEIGVLAKKFSDMGHRLRNIIDDINHVLGQMAESNFKVESTCREEYLGEFGRILEAMGGINGNLSEVLSQINVSAEQVSVGAEQMSSGAQALSQGTLEQASSIEELSAAITEISEHITESSHNLVNANMIIGDTQHEVEVCDGQMNAMIAAMADISHNSGEIGKIIKTIEDIAFQTNILALNAAVEAARAGEAGKGFAVVADEVRNLAQKSAEAAKNTTELISNAINAVEKGTGIADATAASLASIVVHATNITGVIDQISSASKIQADSVAQVSAGVDQISTVVQTNSATAEESAATSEELSGQAHMLSELVGKFEI